MINIIQINKFSYFHNNKNVFFCKTDYISNIFGTIKNIKNDVGLVDCDLYYQMDTSQLEYFIREYRYLYDYCIIVPVHMYGHCANMDEIERIALRHDCMISEDSSHAHGTITNEDRKTGTYGLANAFSLYPGKNLGAIGEAGIITTDNEEIKNYLHSLRNQGTVTKYEYTTLGFNDKLDTIQAIILNEKLKFLPEWNEKRNKVAEQYNWLLGSVGKPDIASYCKYHTYHIYPILVYNREKFIQYLSNRNIPTLIHYPTQVIKHQCCKGAGFITCSNLDKSEYVCDNLVSLPIHPFLSDNNIKYICGVINDYTY